MYFQSFHKIHDKGNLENFENPSEISAQGHVVITCLSHKGKIIEGYCQCCDKST